ncbi:hypothetical protein [Sideroxydans sp. CL21]|nr:hypothetical protein [Sideroxydans sp. CL21]
MRDTPAPATKGYAPPCYGRSFSAASRLKVECDMWQEMCMCRNIAAFIWGRNPRGYLN